MIFSITLDFKRVFKIIDWITGDFNKISKSPKIFNSIHLPQSSTALKTSNIRPLSNLFNSFCHELCMIDRSWTSTSQFNGCRWTWIDNLEKVQFMETHNYIRRESPIYALRSRSIEMGDGEHDVIFDIS